MKSFILDHVIIALCNDHLTIDVLYLSGEICTRLDRYEPLLVRYSYWVTTVYIFIYSPCASACTNLRVCLIRASVCLEVFCQRRGLTTLPSPFVKLKVESLNESETN